VGEEGKLFGSVTAGDIAQQLEAQGFHVGAPADRPARAHQGARRLPRAAAAARRRAPEIKVWVIKQ
jgi:large subunit ribosomal protein L9